MTTPNRRPSPARIARRAPWSRSVPTRTTTCAALLAAVVLGLSLTGCSSSAPAQAKLSQAEQAQLVADIKSQVAKIPHVTGVSVNYSPGAPSKPPASTLGHPYRRANRWTP